jgi:hypothetical protein
MPRFRLFGRRSNSEWAFVATFVAYTVVCVIVYFWFVQPSITGDTTIRIGADSDKYWDAVQIGQERGGFSLSDLIKLEGNLLGPVTIGLLFKGGFGVLCFNFLLFYISLKVAFSIDGMDKAAFGFLMLANAELLPALVTLNKEIFGIFAAVVSAKYIYSARRSKLLAAFVVFVSLLARWEQAGIFIIFLLFNQPPCRGRPKFALISLVAGLSIIYPLLFSLFGVDPNIFSYILEGAGLILKLDAIQAAYGFPLVLPVKALMLLAGKLIQPWIFFTGEFTRVGFNDVQQQISQPLGCAAILIVFAKAVLTGKMRVDRPIALLSTITLIIAAVAPFIQPRYAYPIYVLLSIELARNVGGNAANRRESVIGTPGSPLAKV